MFYLNRKILILFLLLLTTQYGWNQELPNLPKLSEDPSKVEVEAQIDTVQSLARIQFFKRNYDKSLQYADYGLELTYLYDSEYLRFQINSIIGNTLIRINDTVRAKELFKSAVINAEKRNDTAALVGSRIDLGNIYSQQKKYEKAISTFKQTIPLAESANDTIRLFILHYNIQELYLEANEIDEAAYHLDQAGVYVQSLRGKAYRSGYLLSKGRLLLAKKKPDSAISYFKRNIELAKEIDYKDGILDGYESYLKALEEKKDYEQLFHIRKEFDVYNSQKQESDQAAAVDAITANLKIKQVEEQLKATKLENELAHQRASTSRTLLYYVLGVAILFGLSFGLLLRSYRKRQRLFESLKNKNREYLAAKVKSEQFSKEKAQFFSTMSHELRTPLYGIIGISSLLLEDNKLKNNHEDVKSLKFSADYLLALINDVLQLSKLEATEKEQLTQEAFKLHELVDDILTSLEFMRAHNHNEFRVEIDSLIPEYIEGDKMKLSQVLLNLVSNACKFTENGKIIIKIDAIEVTKSKVNLQFTVKDNGIGISEEKQKHIFKEFTQASHDKEYQGTGLGLAIVKKILEQHDSKIEFTSELNKGSRFNFSVWYRISNKTEKAKTLLSAPPTSLAGKTILVVDDNRINRIVTQKILDRQEANSILAENGEIAVEAVKKYKPDLILMDINMPVMNGLEAAKAIREFNATIPIIALTAVAVDELQQNVSASGMNDIIVKPYDVSQFTKSLLRNMS